MGQMGALGTVLMVLGALIGTCLLGYAIASRVRRNHLRRTLGAYPAAFLARGRWERGVMHFTDDALLWYRERSISPLPAVCLSRHLLSMRRLDEQESAAAGFASSELGRKHPEWIAVELSSPEPESSVRGRPGYRIRRSALRGPLGFIPIRAHGAQRHICALGYEQSAGITSWLEAWGAVGRGQWR